MPTFNTDELFAISIGLIDIAAISAFLAGMFRIDFDYNLSWLCS
jgi:hypothetical protein